MKKTRLNKRLVELGLSPSRRKADEAITTGLVQVNGEIATLGTSVTEADTILLGGKQGQSKAPIYVALNKPTGYVCSHASQGEAKTIFELLPKSFAELKIAGRLDKESEGLVLLSSDGEFVQAITHPSAEKEKEYIVKIDQPISSEALKKFQNGVRLYDGVSNFIAVTKINPATLRVTLSEGRNRQIRRTFAQLSYTVVGLQRVRVGKLQLGLLPSGKHRVIQPGEVL